jgi:hypothetical protein
MRTAVTRVNHHYDGGDGAGAKQSWTAAPSVSPVKWSPRLWPKGRNNFQDGPPRVREHTIRVRKPAPDRLLTPVRLAIHSQPSRVAVYTVSQAADTSAGRAVEL